MDDCLAMAVDIYSHAPMKPNGFLACLMVKTAYGLNWQEFHVLVIKFKEWNDEQ